MPPMDDDAIARRAKAILRSTAPDESPPPFADVLARAGKRPRRRAPWRAVAWAATLVLAVSVGWYGRALMVDEPSPDAVPPAVGEPIAAAPAESAAEAPADPVRIVPQTTPTQQPMVGMASGAGGPPAVAAAPPPAPVARRDLSGAGQPAAAMMADRLEEAEAAGWRAVTREEAEQLLGGSVRSVEGLATLDHAVRGVSGGVEVRTRQQLGSGNVLELLQRKVAEDGREARQRTNAATEVRRGDFVITGRGPISVDSLMALLLRIN